MIKKVLDVFSAQISLPTVLGKDRNLSLFISFQGYSNVRELPLLQKNGDYGI